MQASALSAADVAAVPRSNADPAAVGSLVTASRLELSGQQLEGYRTTRTDFSSSVGQLVHLCCLGQALVPPVLQVLEILVVEVLALEEAGHGGAE